jgi:hypothetical protein
MKDAKRGAPHLRGTRDRDESLRTQRVSPQPTTKPGRSPGCRQARGVRHERTPNRVATGVGGGAPATAGEGEGVDPGPGRAGRRAAADAVAGCGQGLRVRRAEGHSEPARPVRRPPSADHLPRLLRARRDRLARPCLRRLLHGGRPGRPPRPSQRPQHHPRVRLPGPAARHRPAEGTGGLARAWLVSRVRRPRSASLARRGTISR